MTTEIKLIVGLVVLIALLGLTYLGYRTVYASGVVSGRAQVQAAWDIDKEQIAVLADKAKLDAMEAESAAQRRNQEIAHEYEDQLSAAHASASSLALRLHDYQARAAAGGRPVPQAPDHPGAASGAAAPGPGLLDVAVANAIAECGAVRAGYVALIGELKSQL